MTPRKPVVIPEPQLEHPTAPRPSRVLLTLAAFAAAGGIFAAVISYATNGTVNTASKSDVLANRAVSERVETLIRKYESENEAHRERNEEAHACIVFLLNGGKRTGVTFVNPDPCGAYTRPGEVPPLPTTTTTRPQSTSTSGTRPTRSSTTTTTRASPTTHGTTTTTACTALVRGRCVSAP